MSELALLVAELESGSTDLVSCLASKPELSHESQLQLAQADQRYRFGRGEPCRAENYVDLLPWLAGDSARQQQLIASEFSLRLGSKPCNELLAAFESRYPNFGEPLVGFLSEQIRQWNERPLEPASFDRLCDRFEDAMGAGNFPPIESYLQLVPTASQPELIRELILIETFHLARGGKPIDWDDYHRRFPEFVELLRLVQKQHSNQIQSSARRSMSTQATPHRGNPNDLSGTYVSDKKVGDLRNGRYRFARKLGEGAYGAVYLAQDMDLKRQVAVKVPSREALEKLVDVDLYLVEAQNVAALDHPHIVTVYDVGRTLDGSIYIVSKFIEGCSLADWIKRSPLDFQSIAKLLERIAEALHHAHQRRLIHRDIKPANILIEEATGTPYVADFGLAIREEDYQQDGRIAGTPAYMSPEQVRGEGHRLDGRSDLFSLGVVMYLILTGRLPFPGQSNQEIAHEITTVEPQVPRSLKNDVPIELERICLKLLRKRASERYANGRELAEDLRVWLTPRANQAASVARTKITPRGLRSFNADDSGFFLDLLPGPRNRDGLPESLRFWKTRIEETDPEKTFKVGLVYGPSGCGKSSLMKAGLLPRLSPKILPIYIEATPDDTEMRLLRAVRKAIPDAEGASLKDILSVIRRRKLVPSGGKLLLVLDQFEQWLFAEQDYAKASLTDALLQCDGGATQALLMVRDDFWLSVSRFLRELDIPILERENSALVDLFDLEHATTVLGLFGTAYGKLPDSTKSWNQDQKEFVRQAIHGLSQDRKVISVRIALLADMMKSRDWTMPALREVGGIDGIGVTFLEEMFGSRHAPIQHRQHQEAARGLLSALLPATGTEIKGSMQCAVSLQKAAGYEQKPRDFQELIDILDKSLRLITPVDEGNGPDNSITRSYQLAHDYLVPSLRDWLTRNQRETKRGRAELRLAERAAVWRINSEHKQLPTLSEWLRILRWTDWRRWTPVERSMMETAWRIHVRNWGGFALILLLLSCTIGYVFEQQQAVSQREQVRSALDSLPSLGAAVPLNIQVLKRLRKSIVLSELESRYQSATDAREKLSLAFALAGYGNVDAGYLISRIDAISDEDTSNLWTALACDRELSRVELQKSISACTAPTLWRRKARLCIASLALGDITVAIDVCEFEGRTDHGLRTWFIHEFPRWKLDPRQLVSTLENCPSSALRSAVCLGLGQIPRDRISVADQRALVELAARWYELPDSSTHSAVAWLLRQWEFPEPGIRDANRLVKGRQWFVNSQGTTMVLIEPSGDPTTGPSQPYWIANREVTRGEFEEFINDLFYAGDKPEPRDWGAMGEMTPTSSHPAVRMEWFDAILFCNWLSLKEGRTPVYQKVGTQTIDQVEFPKWEEQSRSDGYRLLREIEWEYACRTGTQTQWSPGNDEELLADYCQMYPSKTAELCGKKLPNAWGIHDLHGNAWEWCWDSSDVYGEARPVHPGHSSVSARVTRGGGWGIGAATCRSAASYGSNPGARNNNYGFRLALGPVARTELPAQE